MATIRIATIDDAPELARVHVDGWQWGYRGVMPDAYLDALSVDAREARWRAILTAGSDETPTWIAHGAEGGLGFASAGPARIEPADRAVGELRAIYVARRAAGSGVADALHARAIAHLARSHGRALLWVLERNPRARRFYERRGWRADGEARSETFGGVDLRELRYAIELKASGSGASR